VTAQTGLGPREKADVLVEALPYIRRFWGSVVVVKYGGNVLRVDGQDGASGPDGRPADNGVDEATALAAFAEDIVLMRSVGMRPVVVHGGGPQIGALMERVGKQVEFRDGLRVTDAETIDLVRMVLVGQVNRNIVSAINVHGALAVGLSGEDANLITATFRDASLGYVGEVVDVDPVIVEQLLAQGLIPVVATIGSDESGQPFNINADTVAGALAAALGAEKLVFLTDVAGVRSDPADPATLVHWAGADEAERLISTGAATGGMVPKLEACARAVRGGVGRAHILDGRAPHALLLEIFTDEGVGTMIGPDGADGADASPASDGRGAR
jgi:acetylglutamate kinase